MVVYVFGNFDEERDRAALTAAEKLKKEFPEVAFIEIAPNADLPFADTEKVIIVDVIGGIRGIRVIDDPDKIILPPRGTAHDFDLGFQLKYLKKLGKLKRVTVIGLPATGKINYARLQSIFKKLVAQDMQGS